MRHADRPTDVAYAGYVGSARWRNSPARAAELEASRRRCRICSRGEPEVSLEVHHNNYRRLGRERPSDLCTLCTECHGMVTSELRGRRYRDRQLPPLEDVRRMLPGRRLFDPLATPRSGP